jgi:hypothetical protein
MHRQIRARARIGLLSSALVAAVVLAACGSSGGSGSSSGNAQSILRQTFSNTHDIRSGVLDFALTVDPAGSSTLTSPLSLSLSGPFQSHGTGKIPASDFTLAVSGMGHHGSLGVVSTGTTGYVTLGGDAYTLPAADFKRLESSFSSVEATGGGHSGLSGLGIDPEHWLAHPAVVGTEDVGGASTTHVRAGVNIASLLSDLNTFLAKSTAGSASSAVPKQISPAQRQKLASEVKNAQVDIWTGTADRILRKLALVLDIPVTGQLSTELGGMSAAGLGLTIQYSGLNHAQTITTPTKVLPYSQFTTRLRGVLSGIAGGLGSASTGASSSSSAAAPSSSQGSYSQCITNAGQDVAKMQKCASLLSGQ